MANLAAELAAWISAWPGNQFFSQIREVLAPSQPLEARARRAWRPLCQSQFLPVVPYQGLVVATRPAPGGKRPGFLFLRLFGSC